jgi:hypothetical protein
VKTVSNFVLDLARCLSNGLPDAEDSLLDVAAGVLPTIELQSPLETNVVGSSLDVQNGTCFQTSPITLNGAAGPVNQLLLTLAKGLWRFDVSLSIASNFASVGPFVALQLTFPAGGFNLISCPAGGAAAAPVITSLSRTFKILLPRTVTISAVVSATIAGQSVNGHVDILATKLL